MKVLNVVSVALISVAWSGNVFAQSEYQPPMGEQPTYGKRYTPGASEANYVIEVNAAQLLNQGFALEFETRGAQTMNFGADLLFSEKTVKDNVGASGATQSILVAPKIRLYPMQALSGVFLGGKVFLGQVKVTVDVAGTESEKAFTLISPAVHVGYRMLSTFGFTWSLYGGAGVNFPQARFETKHLKNAELTTKSGVAEVISDLNAINRVVRYDIGVTLGVAL